MRTRSARCSADGKAGGGGGVCPTLAHIKVMDILHVVGKYGYCYSMNRQMLKHDPYITSNY